MCGFIGKFLSKKKKIIEPKNFYKRGPDSYGHYSDEKLSVIFRRLAIVDKSDNANQPYNDNEQYVLVFNGEIYNYLELRDELISKGIKFKSDSDTEVLYHLLINQGIDSLNKVNGIFAFAFYNKQSEHLILGRDFIGVKPMYINFDDGVTFGSTYNSVKINNRVHNLNDLHLKSFLKWQSVIFNRDNEYDIQELKPGYYYDSKTNKFTKWTKPKYPKISSKYYCEDLYNLIRECVNSQTPKDQKYAVLLSGGIDSSIIAHHLKDDSNAIYFSLGLVGSEDNETGISEKTAKNMHLNFHKIEITEKQLLQEIKDYLEFSDLPTADGLNTFIISKHINSHGIKVALSGVGGDEVFGGYAAFDTIYLNNLIDSILDLLPDFIQRIKIFYKIRTQFNRNLYFDNKASFFKSYEIPMNNESGSSQSHYIDIRNLYNKYFLQPTILRDVDYFSMINSVEMRVPFLSSKLIDWTTQFSKNNPKMMINKNILRINYKKHLPSYVLERRKTGFNIGLKKIFVYPNKYLSKKIDDLQYFSFKNSHLNLLKNNTIKSYLKNSNTYNFRRIWLFIVLSNWIKKNER